MMPADLTIPKRRETEPALDYRQLQALGLAHVQRLAHQLWTDHNLHDPGITTLELLSYALTDLSYRASLPIADLLAAHADNEAAIKRQFFTARQIMTVRPLTTGDYRKLLIDLKGVKNAWLEPLPATVYLDRELWELRGTPPGHPASDAVTVHGRYQVLIDLDDTITSLGVKARKKATQQALDEVQRTLNANRNLCQEFVRFDVVKSQEFMLCGKIELTPEADTPQVQAELLFRIQRYLAPAVRRYTLAELLEKKRSDGGPYTADAIFDGPRLTGGFIDDHELTQADLRKELFLSDVICIIMDIPGVQAVREIVIRPVGAGKTADPKERWRLPVTKGRKAVLASAPVTFYKRNMPVQPDQAEVDRRRQALEEAAAQVEERILREDFPIPLGQYRDTGSYYSFQNHFPALYGLSEAGLDATADPRRRALAYQLKGYLLFFDQIMADYLAQLRHVKDLLSVNSHRRRTYFSSLVDSFRDYLAIYRVEESGLSPDDARIWLRRELREIVETEEVRVERRNRFLDHLLARFGERFTEYAHLMYTLFGTDGRHLIPHKQRFLADLPATGSERGLAFDYFGKEAKDLWDSDNVSGYERRICLLLGMAPRRRILSVEPLDEHARVTTNPDGAFGFRILEYGAEKLVSTAEYATGAQAEAALRLAVRYGKFSSHCRTVAVKSGKNRHTFQIVDDHDQPLAVSVNRYDYPHTALAAGAALAEYLREQYPDEGMYVIENLLLLPEQEGDPFLPVCVVDGQQEPEDKDPYSWRIHVVLPGYTSRFADLSFRRYAEQVIREETPAHLLPKVCWISREQMELLEPAYREWLLLKAGTDVSDRQQKLLRFIYTLLDAKNIYPPRKLHCGRPGNEQPRFILNRSSLGTGETT